MSILSFIMPVEKRTQLFLRDDGRFKFRKLAMKETFLVTKKKGEVNRGWKHFFKLQFPFAGYKRAFKPDMVTISFDRDIILDPWGIMTDTEKPLKDAPMHENPWISEIAEAQTYKHASHPGKSTMANWVVIMAGIPTVAIGIVIALIAMKGAL